MSKTYSLAFSISKTKRDQQVFEENAQKVGLLPEDFGRKFYAGGKVYRLSGVNPKAKKNFLIVTSLENGKKYSMSPVFFKAFSKFVR